jgi:hypothetical protein
MRLLTDKPSTGWRMSFVLRRSECCTDKDGESDTFWREENKTDTHQYLCEKVVDQRHQPYVLDYQPSVDKSNHLINQLLMTESL